MSRLTYKALDPKRSSVIDYTAHKSWTITDETAASFGVKVLSGSYSSGEFNAATDPKTDGFYQTAIFNSIQHLYYSDPNNTTISSDSEFLSTQERELLSYVQVWSIPSEIYGKRIKPGSVYINAAEDYWDDGEGNLFTEAVYDKSDYKDIIPPLPKNSYVYLSFDEEREIAVGSEIADKYKLKYRSSVPKNVEVRNGVMDYGRKTGTQIYAHPFEYRAIKLNGSASLSSGSESIIELVGSRNPYSSDWDNDFCINMWVNIPPSQSVSQSYTGHYKGSDNIRGLEAHTENVIASSRGFTNNPQDDNITPWEISVVNHSGDASEIGKIYARRGRYDNMLLLSSSNAQNIGGDVWTHVIFQKTGSNIQLMVGSGSTDISSPPQKTWSTDTITGSIISAIDPLLKYDTNTNVDVCIGARRSGFKQWKRGSSYYDTVPFNPAYTLPFSGSIDEFVIYNKALDTGTTQTIDKIHNDSTNPIVGNIFYKHGIITLTSPFKEGTTEATDNFTLTFSGSHDITAHSYRCVIEDGEFNMTLNPTAREGYSLNNPRAQSFTTGSDFSPYITTIGLYNNMKELLAIGKLAQPVKSPQDFDITFVVQFDT